MVMRKVTVLILAALLTLAACGNDDTTPGASSTTVPAAPDLDGRTFLSTDITENGKPKTLVAGSRIRLSFTDESLSVSGGCNIGSGPYSVVDGHLRVEPMGMTEMACDEPRMAQDDWVFAVLGDRPALQLEGTTLILTTDTVTLTLEDREVADPDRPLVGTVWVGSTLIDGDVATNAPELAKVRLTFGADGQVAVNAGCNTGGGSYEDTDTTITFGPVALTKMGCDEDRMAVESHVAAVLDGEVEFTIEAASLTLTNGDRGLGLTAEE